MNQETVDNTSDKNESNTEPVDELETIERDSILQYLINMANVFEIGYDLTILVGGQFYTGTLVDGRKYIKYISGIFDENSSKFGHLEYLGNSMAEALRSWTSAYPTLSEYYQQYPDEDNPDNPQFELPETDKIKYLHLKNVRSINANMTFPESVILRFKISQIESWFMGRVSR